MQHKRPLRSFREICRDICYDFLIEVSELLAPSNRCLWCGGSIPNVELLQKTALCPHCRAELAEYTRCPHCAAFLPENISAEQAELHQKFCSSPDGSAITNFAAFAPYHGALRQNLLRLKYRNNRRLAKPLGWELARVWRQSGWQADVMIPVPLYAAKRRQRGYNQCDLLARACAEVLDLPVLTDVLLRTRDTEVQNKLGALERQENVRAAFACTPEAAGLAGKRIILIDDIITSGSTMRACAAALQEYSPAAVYGLAVAGKLYVEQDNKGEQL